MSRTEERTTESWSASNSYLVVVVSWPCRPFASRHSCNRKPRLTDVSLKSLCWPDADILPGSYLSSFGGTNASARPDCFHASRARAGVAGPDQSDVATAAFAVLSPSLIIGYPFQFQKIYRVRPHTYMRLLGCTYPMQWEGNGKWRAWMLLHQKSPSNANRCELLRFRRTGPSWQLSARVTSMQPFQTSTSYHLGQLPLCRCENKKKARYPSLHIISAGVPC